MLRAALIGRHAVRHGQIHSPSAAVPVGPDRWPQPARHRRGAVPRSLQEIKQPKCTEKAAFYAGCLIDFAYPEMGEAVVKILNKAGIRVIFPKDQTCCGAPARYSGAYEVAAQNAVDNIQALLEGRVEYVVSACPTCTVALSMNSSTRSRPWATLSGSPSQKTCGEKSSISLPWSSRLVDRGV